MFICEVRTKWSIHYVIIIFFGQSLMGFGSANDATSDDGGMASVVSL